jgi:hypothetical protein
MKIQATKPIRVFIDKGHFKNAARTQVDKIPTDRQENLSWKGCYYTIQPKEIFSFDRSNDWDTLFFKLNNGAEFKASYGKLESFLTTHNAILLNRTTTNNNEKIGIY